MILIGVVALILIIGAAVFLNLRPRPTNGPPVTLNVWGMEPSAAFIALMSAYPYATVKYTQVDPENYGSLVLGALAAGTGPDVFEIGNRALPRWQSVLAPLTIASSSSSGFGPLQISQLYPDIVSQDWISGAGAGASAEAAGGAGQIYGLPLSIDTLVMAYNKDLLNAANIAVPPTNWNDFDADVAKLRAVNGSGQITQAAAAIGGADDTVPHAADILALLMLQNGTQMTDANRSSAAFASQVGGAPGPSAFNFYLQFANAASPYYTWSSALGPAFDSFAAGKTAIIFVYQSDLATLKAKAPFLNYALAPIPQAKGATVPVNYANYRGFVASKAGQQAAAWNFILYEAAQDGAKSYLTQTGQPPALRTDIAASLNDVNLSVFASQELTAKSWYEADDKKAEAALGTAIKNVLNGAETATRALTEAETAVTQLMR